MSAICFCFSLITFNIEKGLILSICINSWFGITMCLSNYIHEIKDTLVKKVFKCLEKLASTCSWREPKFSSLTHIQLLASPSTSTSDGSKELFYIHRQIVSYVHTYT